MLFSIRRRVIIKIIALTTGLLGLAFPSVRAGTLLAGDPVPPSLLHPITPSNAYDTPPKLLRGFLPWYPLRQAQVRKPGEVVVEFNVGVDGKTNDIRIVSSTAYGFWKYAQWAVEKWKFTPAQKRGQPVVVRMRVDFQFHA
jgi:TonB family protein